MAQGAAPQRELIESEGSRSAPYAAAVVYDRLVFTSGALPVADDGTVPAEFKAQVRVALGNLGDALEAAGADWSTVLKVNGYVVDIDRLPEMNEVYLEIVGEAAKPVPGQ